MTNGIIRNDYTIQQQQITDTSYFGFCWPKHRVVTLHDILHAAKKETLRGGHFITYYTSSKYYGRTRMHDNIVPWALRALGTKSYHTQGKFESHGLGDEVTGSRKTSKGFERWPWVLLTVFLFFFSFFLPYFEFVSSCLFSRKYSS